MKKIESFTGSYSFLSNFFEWPVRYENVLYPSVENAFQAAKTVDLGLRRAFESCKPAEAKKMGKKVPLREGWNELRLQVMEELLLEKFSAGVMRQKLVATEDTELVEGNWWRDRFWGVYQGAGHNHLGRLLMKVRRVLNDGLSG